MDRASLVAQQVKNPPAMWETWVQPLSWEDSPEGGHSNPLQYSCLENPHGQSRPAGYSPRDHKESDATKQRIAHYSGKIAGEISITSDMQMTPPLGQKVKNN